MKQDYSDKILKEFDEHPIRCKIWADTRFFYLQYIWPILHPIENCRLKKMSKDVKQFQNEMRKRELMHKYDNLTDEQVNLIWQKVFSDDDTDS